MTVTMTAGTLLLPLSAELERSVTVRLPSLQGSGLPRGVQGMPFWCRQEKFVECKFEAGEDPPKIAFLRAAQAPATRRGKTSEMTNLLSNAECGPSNALSTFAKHSQQDRTLQQDRWQSGQGIPQVLLIPFLLISADLLRNRSGHQKFSGLNKQP
jgi:hypothetical protein